MRGDEGERGQRRKGYISTDAFSVKHVSPSRTSSGTTRLAPRAGIRVPKKRPDKALPPRKYNKVAGVSMGRFPQLCLGHVDFPPPMGKSRCRSRFYIEWFWVLLFVGSSRRRFYHDWVSTVGLLHSLVLPSQLVASRWMCVLYLELMPNTFRSSVLNVFSGGWRVGMRVRWGVVGCMCGVDAR